MSTRQLRKLQKQKELQALEAQGGEDNDSDSDSDESVVRAKPGGFSGFAALGDVDDDDSEDAAEAEAGETTQQAETKQPTQQPETPHESDSPPAKPKKSKKKKKKAKKAQTPAADTGAPHDSDDDIDRALRELNVSRDPEKATAAGGGGGGGESPSDRAYGRICDLLRVNTHHLKVLNEMRQLFGREAIAAAQSEEDQEAAARERERRSRRPQQAQNVDLETFLRGRPGDTLPEVTLRRNPFLAGSATWPRAPTEGLTMRQVGDDGPRRDEPGTTEFAFAHDEAYSRLERDFFQLVQLGDPMQLVHLLQRRPYHVWTLTQVSRFAKQQGDTALSADLCERALFTFGRVSVSAFRAAVERGRARLDFRRPENRQFWLAGYHYLRSLVVKGTYRTGLEWAKLLLAMDPTDPYGLVHFLHPLAIRAYEARWLVEYCGEGEGEEGEGACALNRCDTARDYVRQTLVLARLQLGDEPAARALLRDGMLRLPWLYGALYRALGLDVPRAVWGAQPRDPHEELFVQLYIHQTKTLWDNAQATALLKEVAGERAKDASTRAPEPPVAGRNVARFIFLDGTPELMGLVPDGMLSETPNFEFDPLPPPLEDNVLSHESQKMLWGQGGGGFRFRFAQDPVGGDPAGNLLGVDAARFRQLIDRMRAQGAPAEQVREAVDVLHHIEAVEAGEAGEAGEWDDLGAPQTDGAGSDGEEGGEEGREAAPRSGAGFIPYLMDLLASAGPSRSGGDDDDNDEEGLRRMPGAYVEDDTESDTEDEMPAPRDGESER